MDERSALLEKMDRALGGLRPPRPSQEELEAFRLGYYEGLADGLRESTSVPGCRACSRPCARPGREDRGSPQ